MRQRGFAMIGLLLALVIILLLLWYLSSSLTDVMPTGDGPATPAHRLLENRMIAPGL